MELKNFIFLLIFQIKASVCCDWICCCYKLGESSNQLEGGEEIGEVDIRDAIGDNQSPSGDQGLEQDIHPESDQQAQPNSSSEGDELTKTTKAESLPTTLMIGIGGAPIIEEPDEEELKHWPTEKVITPVETKTHSNDLTKRQVRDYAPLNVGPAKILGPGDYIEFVSLEPVKDDDKKN